MKKVLFILLLLCSIHFWGFNYLSKEFNYATDFMSLLIMGVGFLMTINKEGVYFRNAIILFIIGLFINIFAAYFNFKQRILDTFLIFGPFYFILFYFILHKMELSRKYIEDVIIIFAVLYSVIYIVQLIAYPVSIFTNQMHVDRGTIRLRIEGNGFLVLAYFLLLNRYLVNKKMVNIILMGLFFIVLVKGGFRTLTVGAIFLTGIMFLRLYKYAVQNYIAIILIVIAFAGISYTRGTSAVFKKMVYTTQAQKNEGYDYIRVRQFMYFFNNYPENASYYIVGGGMPAGESINKQKMQYLKNNYGFYWVDLGLVGFYIVVGGIALAGILWYALKAAFRKMPPDGVYLNFYFLYLLIVSITTIEIYRGGMFSVEAIALYLIDKIYDENRLAISKP